MTTRGDPSSNPDNMEEEDYEMNEMEEETETSRRRRTMQLSFSNDNDNDNDDDDGSHDSSIEQGWTAEQLSRASYKDLGTPHEVEIRYLNHLLRTSQEKLLALYQAESTTTRDYSLEIDTFQLLQMDPVLGTLTLKFPSTLLPLLENAIIEAQIHLEKRHQEQYSSSSQATSSAWQNGFVKGAINNNNRNTSSRSGGTTNTSNNNTTVTTTRVHARLIHLPPTCTKSSLHSLQANDVGKIWQVSGTVVRSSPVQMYESCRTYQCQSSSSSRRSRGGSQQQQQQAPGCGQTFIVKADLEQPHNALIVPETCPLFSLAHDEPCRGTKFKELSKLYTDYQEVKIQDAASRLGIGTIPKSLLVKLQHDLVDQCQPGDEVVIVGILISSWPPTTIVDADCPVSMCLEAHSLRVIQEKVGGGAIWNEVSVGEMERLRKEFQYFWNQPRNVSHPIAARDFICRAVCPKLYGMALVKLALLVSLIGGVSVSRHDRHNHQENAGNHDDNDNENIMQNDDDDLDPFFQQNSDDSQPEPFAIPQTLGPISNLRHDTDFHNDDQQQPSPRRRRRQQQQQRSVNTRRRDQSHMLLVGDPGTGKSQFLRFAAALCPRSVLTTGVGTTSAGLTCAAVREGSGKEFALEAGALVLADKGVCCIDEFGCIRKEDRTTIHEAMEQQTLSVAKAGIVCKLNCRATIIAVMNPKDSLYDNHASLSRNTGLGTPLLSRFDIIFKLVDSSDASRDANITTHLLNRAIQGAGYECDNNNQGDDNNEQDLYDATPWPMDKLRAYISIVKDTLFPTLTDDAATLLERHYEKCRLVADRSALGVTVRFLESMIRLSQAHARLMFRPRVLLEDAVAVVRIMECSAFAYGGFDGSHIVLDENNNNNARDVSLYRDPMTVDFSPDADLEFLEFEYKLLERHGLLDKMPAQDRKKAFEFMGGKRGNLQGPDWSQLERSTSLMTRDHYGRFHWDERRNDKKRRVR